MKPEVIKLVDRINAAKTTDEVRTSFREALTFEGLTGDEKTSLSFAVNAAHSRIASSVSPMPNVEMKVSE